MHRAGAHHSAFAAARPRARSTHSLATPSRCRRRRRAERLRTRRRHHGFAERPGLEQARSMPGCARTARTRQRHQRGERELVRHIDSQHDTLTETESCREREGRVAGLPAAHYGPSAQLDAGRRHGQRRAAVYIVAFLVLELPRGRAAAAHSHRHRRGNQVNAGGQPLRFIRCAIGDDLTRARPNACVSSARPSNRATTASARPDARRPNAARDATKFGDRGGCRGRAWKESAGRRNNPALSGDGPTDIRSADVVSVERRARRVRSRKRRSRRSSSGAWST